MALQLQHVGDHPALKNGPAAFRRLIARQLDLDAPAQRRRWAYYANPARPAARDDDRNGSDRPYRQAQEWGLPSRLTGGHQGHGEATHDPDPAAVARKEIVVENDIGWRIDTHVDFLFGKPPAIDSTLDGGRGDELAALVRLIVAGSGGMAFLQRLALLGAVHGFADVLVHCDPDRGGGEDLGHVAPCDLPLLGDSAGHAGAAGGAGAGGGLRPAGGRAAGRGPRADGPGRPGVPGGVGAGPPRPAARRRGPISRAAARLPAAAADVARAAGRHRVRRPAGAAGRLGAAALAAVRQRAAGGRRGQPAGAGGGRAGHERTRMRPATSRR